MSDEDGSQEPRGYRAKVGRPRKYEEPPERRTATLPKEYARALEHLGGGSLSSGIKALVDTALAGKLSILAETAQRAAETPGLLAAQQIAETMRGLPLSNQMFFSAQARASADISASARMISEAVSGPLVNLPGIDYSGLAMVAEAANAAAQMPAQLAREQANLLRSMPALTDVPPEYPLSPPPTVGRVTTGASSEETAGLRKEIAGLHKEIAELRAAIAAAREERKQAMKATPEGD